MPESECIKDPWEAACPFVQKSSMITLLVIFQKLYISVGRWCVSFFTLKPITFRNPFLAIAGELPHIYAPHFQFMSNDLKCRDKSQVNSMTFNNLKKRLFPAKELSPCWKRPSHPQEGVQPFSLWCLLHAEQLCLDDSNMKWALSLVKVWWPGDAGVGRCRRVLRGQSGTTVAWQQPVGTAVSTPVKVSPVWPCTPSTSIRS